MSTFAIHYNGLLTRLLDNKEIVEETNKRTGSKIRILPGGCSFMVDEEECLPVPWNRKVYPKTAAAEIAWYLMGTQNVEWLHQHTKIWKKFYEKPFINEDIKILERSYGYRWRVKFGRDQILCAIHALKQDPSSRRVYITAWDAGDDGLNSIAEDQKNVPCPIGFTLSITKETLYSSLFIRSSDVFVGLPYDVMGHAILMSLFAGSLGVKIGKMQVTLAHPHLYESHFLSAAIAVKERVVRPYLAMPDWRIEDVIGSPDSFVSQYEDLANRCDWPSYNPKPKVIA